MPPLRRRVPAAGRCAITRPRFTFVEYARRTLPSAQWEEEVVARVAGENVGEGTADDLHVASGVVVLSCKAVVGDAVEGDGDRRSHVVVGVVDGVDAVPTVHGVGPSTPREDVSSTDAESRRVEDRAIVGDQVMGQRRQAPWPLAPELEVPMQRQGIGAPSSNRLRHLEPAAPLPFANAPTAVGAATAS